MENEPNKEKYQRSEKNAVHIIAIIYLILSIIGAIILLVFCFLQMLSFWYFLIACIISVIQLILLFSLDNAIRRITVLENTLLRKSVVDKKELGIENNPEDNLCVPDPTLDTSGIKYCKNCGYQLFPEDKECPYCKTKIEDEQD